MVHESHFLFPFSPSFELPLLPAPNSLSQILDYSFLGLMDCEVLMVESVVHNNSCYLLPFYSVPGCVLSPLYAFSQFSHPLLHA